MTDALDLTALVAAIRPLEAQVVGAGEVHVRRVVPLSGAGDPETLTFSTRSGPEAAALLVANGSGAAFVPRSFTGEISGAVLLRVDDPRLAAVRALRAIRPDAAASLPPGVHPSAECRPQRCGEDLRVGAGAVITEAVALGDRIRIHPNATVGTAGFGFARNEAGALEFFPHVGSTILGDDVEVFPHASVDRATLHQTVVGRGTKLDHHVQVSHNCWIGEDTVICAGAILAGSVVVGDRCFIGAGARIKQSVRIGDDATVGMGAVVLEDVPAGATVIGIPARVVGG